MRHRAGEVIDGWTLEEFLGGGGNGEVWRAAREREVAALKLLFVRNPSHDAYRRFRAEVRFLRDYQHEGVLPLIDASVPDQLAKGQFAWLAMPQAELASVALDGASLRAVVEAVSAFAATLSDLADEGVSHRDVKPDNLFHHQDRWKVGDWGLVSYPSKEALTRAGRKLGPAWFLAPEMLSDPGHADGSRADVYSLAKTLWVLAAGQRFPATGGTLRRDEPAFRLSSVVADDRADQLERLLEDSTAHNSASRPTMRDFLGELNAWLRVDRSFQDPSPHSAPELSDLRRRIEAKTAPSQLAMKRRLNWTKESRDYFEPWKGVVERQVLSVIREAVPEATLLNATADDLYSGGLKDVADLGNAVADISATGVHTHSGPIGPTHVIMKSLLGQTLIADRPFVRLVAGHVVLHGSEKTLVWSDYEDAPLASAQHHEGLISLVDGLRDSARNALETFAEKIEELVG